MHTNSNCREILLIMEEIIDLIKTSNVNPVNVIDSFIDGFTSITSQLDNISKNNNPEIGSLMENVLVTIVDAYRNEQDEQAELIIKSQLIHSFLRWKENIIQQLKQKILILGVNQYSSMFHRLLDESIFNVIGYLNVPKIQLPADSLNGSPIFSLHELQLLDFDYIVITSEIHNQIEAELFNLLPKEKIINFFNHSINYISIYQKLYSNNYEFSYVYSNLDRAIHDKSIEVIFTGSSYTLHAVDYNLISRKSVKLCWASQDLYYDYQLAKKAIENNSSIKQCVIGMAYYSFDFDLSKSKTQNYLIDKIYNPILNDTHHYSLNNEYKHYLGLDQIESHIEIPTPFTDLLLTKTYINSLNYSFNPELNNSIWNSPCEKIPFEWLGKQRAISHSNLNYPDTVLEYLKILDDYLAFLAEHSIEPIIVVYPTSPFYYQHFDNEIKANFYKKIHDLKKKYEFTIYDFFESKLFNENDFADCDHLNHNGAIKMTSQINQFLVTTK